MDRKSGFRRAVQIEDLDKMDSGKQPLQAIHDPEKDLVHEEAGVTQQLQEFEEETGVDFAEFIPVIE